MCAIEAGKRGRSVLVLEHNQRVGEKILISGGGRCNFTNLEVDSSSYLSENPHFCKSALGRFRPSFFIDLLEKHAISYHEKKLGQLFCNEKSSQIIDMLLKECQEADVRIIVNCKPTEVTKQDRFQVSTTAGNFDSGSVVIATGGLSIPQLGASNFAFTLARQFDLRVTRLRPGLVPLTFAPEDLRFFGTLAGISVDAVVSTGGASFRENILFTHRGLSGPGILQASSYWSEGEKLSIDLLPDRNAADLLIADHRSTRELSTVLDQYLPRRLAVEWCDRLGGSKPMQRYTRKELEEIALGLHNWGIVPSGTEGFGKAEVTVGGIDTRELSSKTMESQKCPGLFFVGECVDVTGWLGGYNFHWAWASGWVAGQYA